MIYLALSIVSLTLLGCRDQSARFDNKCPAYRQWIISAARNGQQPGLNRNNPAFEGVADADMSDLSRYCDTKYVNDEDYQKAKETVLTWSKKD